MLIDAQYKRGMLSDAKSGENKYAKISWPNNGAQLDKKLAEYLLLKKS